MRRAAPAGTPEVRVVVRHPHRHGPIAPYRFTITVVFALFVSGTALWQAVETGIDLDTAMLRTAGSAAFAWIVLGRISKILASSNQPVDSPINLDET